MALLAVRLHELLGSRAKLLPTLRLWSVAAMESVGVKGATPLFSSLTPNWATPSDLYRQLYDEFLFTLDPCPLRDAQIWDGAAMSWAGERVYCNPPYGRGIDRWLAKAREAKLAVYLLPARTDTAWWHDYAMSADEIRFIRGRLRFNNQGSAPFPSVVLIYGS